MGYSVKYRIMTELSKFGFGKYADLTVGDVIRLDETYIPYAYYNCSMISFCEDILEMFNLARIEKPGKSEDAWKKWQKDFYGAMDGEERFRYRAHLGKKLRAIARKRAADIARFNNLTKGALQQINHGHGARMYLADDGVTYKR